MPEVNIENNVDPKTLFDMSLTDAKKEKIFQSLVFHFATYACYAFLTRDKLKQKPQAFLSAQEIEYLDKYARYEAYIERKGIFSDMGVPQSSPGACFLVLKQGQFAAGGDLVRFKRKAAKREVMKTRVVSKKFLFFTIKKKENYMGDEYYFDNIPVMTKEVNSMCNEFAERLSAIGLEDVRISFHRQYGTTNQMGYLQKLEVKPCFSWEAIKAGKLEDEAIKDSDDDSFKEVKKTKLYEINEWGRPRSYSAKPRLECMNMEVDIGGYREKVRQVARKYYEEHYGELDF